MHPRLDYVKASVAIVGAAVMIIARSFHASEGVLDIIFMVTFTVCLCVSEKESS